MILNRISGFILRLLPVTVIGATVLLGNSHGRSDDPADSRAELVAQIDRNVNSGRQVIAAARSQMERFDGETRAEFLQIEKAVQSAETRLRRSLRWAESASPENWSRARAALAANYEAYAQAVAEVERLLAMEPLSSDRRAPRSG